MARAACCIDHVCRPVAETPTRGTLDGGSVWRGLCEISIQGLRIDPVCDLTECAGNEVHIDLALALGGHLASIFTGELIPNQIEGVGRNVDPASLARAFHSGCDIDLS